MDKLETTVTMKGIAKYTVPSFTGYGVQTKYVYTMESEDGTIYVWKTTTYFTIKVRDDARGWEEDSNGRKWAYWEINRGDIIRIKASIKGQSEYNGQPQTELTRVTAIERIFAAPTWEELAEERKKAQEELKRQQLESIKDGDILWHMPYKQFKERYSDCETLAGSYEKKDYTPAEITVIIRAGRLVPSGVRGMHFHGYEYFVIEDGKKYRACYRAVSEDNALRRVNKDYPKATEITPGKIYDYGM